MATNRLLLMLFSIVMTMLQKAKGIDSADGSNSNDPAAVAAVKSGDIKALLEILHGAKAQGILQQVVDETNQSGATALQ